MDISKFSNSAIRAGYFRRRGPVSKATARKQIKQVTTRAQAIKVLQRAGIVTRSGNLKAKFR